MSNPEAFLPALNADCHFGGLNGIVVTDGGPNDLATWEQQLNAFAVGIFGCTQAGLGAIDAGAATIHDLLPAGQANVTLTQADVKLLVETFVNAVVTEVTDDYYTNVFSGVYPAGALLTDEQVLQLQAELNAIAAATPNVSPSTTLYTYNTCVADAGSADASDGQ
ncbi:MAG TPA: hypothetical protein VEK07_07395 [Polyangiaceae bacterium]|nr:hypothetical protein [Polyangiaceae bacterium]